MKMREKEMKKELKRQHAQELYDKQLRELEKKQLEVEIKNQEFQHKQEEK